jgi:MFS transporter, DHA1 family, staphyloferrin A biosynthesis exporter
VSGSHSNNKNDVNIPDKADNLTGGEKTGTFKSLSIRNFRLLLTGTLLSNAGQWIQQVTLSWLVFDLTGSGTILGTINFVRSIASLGMMPVAGLLIDRLKRRNLLMIENGFLFVITFTLGLLLVLGYSHLWFLFIFAFMGGMVQTVDIALRQVLVFDLVPRSQTPNALALIQTGWSLMRSFGPMLGSFLILLVGAGGNFLVQSCAYILIVVTIMQIHFPVQKAGVVSGSPLANIKEGMRHVMKGRVTRTFTLMGFILPLFIIPIFTILPPIYAVEVFGDGSGRILGYLLASVGVGGIFGGVVIASLGNMQRRGLLQLAALFMLSLTLVGFAFSTQLWLSLLLLAFAGFFEIIFLITNQTLLQLSIPDNLRGRVTSVVNLNAALSPLGGLVAGVGSDLLGGPKMITIVMAGIGATIAVLVLLFSSTVRNYRLSQGITSTYEDVQVNSDK